MAESFTFNADIQQLVSYNHKSVYANKEVFLYELILNAKDSLDKIQHESITDPAKLEAQPNFFIDIMPDKRDATLTILDSDKGVVRHFKPIPYLHKFVGNGID